MATGYWTRPPYVTAPRRPPLSDMTDRLTREAAQYRRPFVTRGRSAWFAFIPSAPFDQSYVVRGCPTWREAYAWACSKVDKCLVCGNCSHDHDGWKHPFTAMGSVVVQPRPDPRPVIWPTTSDAVAAVLRDHDLLPATTPRCLDCRAPAGTAHELGCGRYESECGWRLGLCKGCKKCDPATSQYSRCTRGCNDHTGHALGPGCYQHDYPRQLTHGEWTPSEGP